MKLLKQEYQFVNNRSNSLFLTKLVFLFLFWTNVTYGQRHNSAPLFEFFQQHADSTIILSHLQTIYDYPEYYIVSKTGDTINMYTYRYYAPIKTPGKVDVPKAIAQRVNKTNYEAMRALPDINALFQVKVVSKDTLNRLWNAISRERIWEIKDDKMDGKGCPIIPGKENVSLFDGGGPIFRLLTKEGSKELEFYAPNFFEEYCPGRKGRISAVRVEKLFKDYFTAAGEKDFGKHRKLKTTFRSMF
jgi:hypothetical protein